ncbi:MAG: transcriptional regulator, partial [Thermoguttaceae bacterium]|nr:transcriptional regulator [Thermoguttaceae bacterium]
MSQLESSISRDIIEAVVRKILMEKAGIPSPSAKPELVVSISARHIHLTDADVETLFGKGRKLTKMKDLYQDGFFAAQETVMLIGPRKRMLPSVRILGPTRKESQVELSFTDAISLGLDPPVRESGKLEGTPGCILVGSAG